MINNRFWGEQWLEFEFEVTMMNNRVWGVNDEYINDEKLS